MKTCKHCGKEFSVGPSQFTKQFCTSKCSQRYHRPLVPIRIVVMIRCEGCGELMKPREGVNKRFCSRLCRSRVAKARLKAATKDRPITPPRLNVPPPQKRIWGEA